MRYGLYFLIQGHLGISHFGLRQQVAKRFGVQGAVREQPPSHLTLKYDFEANEKQIEEIHCLVSHFVKSRDCQDCYFSIGGIGQFGESTIFMNAVASPEAKDVMNQLFSQLKNLPWMTWKDESGKPIEAEFLELHATLAYKDVTPEQYPEIYAFIEDSLKNQEPVNYLFNHIAICPLIDGYRQVERVYYFKDPPTSLHNSINIPIGHQGLCDSGHLKIPDLVQVEGTIEEILPLAKSIIHFDEKRVRFWKSDHVDALVNVAIERRVAGLENKTKFADIVNIIIQKHCNAILYGGYLRDIFACGQLSDDIDMLYTLPVNTLQEVCQVHNWDFYRKKEELTGQNGFLMLDSLHIAKICSNRTSPR